MIPTAASTQVHTMTGTWLSEWIVSDIDQEIERDNSTLILTGNIRALLNQGNHGIEAEAIEDQGSRSDVLGSFHCNMNEISNIQATNEEDSRKKRFLGLGNRQCPHNSHRHDQENEIREDIGDLKAIVEFGGVKTGSFNGRVPELLGGNANKSTGNVNTHNPEADESKHDIHCNCHVSDCKESLIQRQNGEFNEGNTTGIDKVVGESKLS